MIKLKSTYSIRIYELLKQYERVKKRTITLQTLRYYVDAIHIYPNYANFKQRILTPVQIELNKNTDISFEFKEIKKGRKVDKIKFYIHSKKNKLYEPDYKKIHSKPSQFKNYFELQLKNSK
ncbi:replication initiation protein [Bacillus cereus]